jgi:hypothetical protein
MKLIIESNGTLKGTKLEFSMTADEIPKMVEKHRRRKLRLKRAQPPDIVVPGEAVEMPLPAPGSVAN